MIISVVNIKGGVGKTTTSMALATVATRRGEAVRVLDADPQGSASLWALEAEEKGTPMGFAVEAANISTIKRLAKRGHGGALVIIDTPPSGAVTDVALDVADFVIVPVSPSETEVYKTFDTIETLEANGKPYAVLVNRVVKNTLSYRKLMGELANRLDVQVSYFDTQIPMRERIRNAFGAPFGRDLFGYEAVYDEIAEFRKVV